MDDLVTQLRTYGRQLEQDVASPAESAPTVLKPEPAAPYVRAEHGLWPGTRSWAVAAVVLVVTIASVWGLSRRTPVEPVDTPATVPTTTGWVAFAAYDSSLDTDLYLVRDGSRPERIAGSDNDEVAQVCPAFAPDGDRLVFGQAAGQESTGFEDAALVITDLDADGVRTTTETIPLEGASRPPCGIWSPDGRWVAFGVDPKPQEAQSSAVEEVWLVDTEAGGIRRLSGLSATDLDWRPDASELAIANHLGIDVYSVATDDLRSVIDFSGVMSLAWSPDGQTIAFQRIAAGGSDLLVVNADGTGERRLAAAIPALHGIGPVWSPDGNRIAYQRTCVRLPPELPGSCREEHEVVLVTVREGGPQPAGTKVTISAPTTTEPEGRTWWYPWSVTWSPDGSALLYHAWGSTEGFRSYVSGLLAVPVDAMSPPTVLFLGDDDVSRLDVPPRPIQSWVRKQTG